MDTADPTCAINMLDEGIMFGDTAQVFTQPDTVEPIFWNSFRDSIPWGAYLDNVPSGERVASSAYWTYQGKVVFNPPVSSVEFLWDSSHNLRFTAYNSFGFIIDQEIRPPNHVGGGSHAYWDSLRLSASSDQIAQLFIDYTDGPTGYFFIDDLKITRKAPPGIECNPSPVRRGDPVTCEIILPVDEVNGWKFQGMTEAGDPVTVPSPSTSMSWSGEGVVSGQVSALVTINGAPSTLKGSLDVEDRSGSEWSWNSADWNFVSGGAAQPHCAAATNFGDVTIGSSTDMGVNLRVEISDCGGGVLETNRVLDPLNGLSIKAVSSGPNAGLIYVLSTTRYKMHRGTAVNPYFTPNGTEHNLVQQELKRCQREDPSIQNPVGFHMYNTVCRKKVQNIADLFDALWKHEEYGIPGAQEPTGHQARFEMAAGLPENDPAAEVEKHVAETVDRLRLVLQEHLLRIDDAMFAIGDDHGFVNGHFVDGNKCGSVWLFDPSTSKFSLTELKNTVQSTGARVCI